jgi:DNA-binding CsgD family transcriptional regulator
VNRADLSLAAMRADEESDWPSRVLAAIAAAPLVDEAEILSGAHWGTSELTPRELGALRLAAHGMGMKESAALLDSTVAAVFSLLRQVRRKLRAKNTTHAVALAIWDGLL